MTHVYISLGQLLNIFSFKLRKNMKKKIEKILGSLLGIAFLFVLAYMIFGHLYFRFSDPTNTETEIFLELITLGGYERQ